MIRNLENHWRLALALIAVLTTLSALTNTASAQTCTVSCLRVYSIDVTNLGSSIRGIVKLTDETGSGAGARSTVVHALWTRPDGSTLDQYAVIGTRLRAQFSLYTAGAPGSYTLTVVDATKSGYTFDPDNSSLLSKSITIGSPINQPPVAVPNADVVSGSTPLNVNFDSYGSHDPDGTIVGYAWDFGDGSSSNEANPSHTYTNVGNFTTTLTVTDNIGATASGSISVTVTDSNAGCTINCMSVDNIVLSYKRRKGQIKGLVTLVDENDNAVGNAAVHVVWTLPDGSTIDQTKNVRKSLSARFFLKADVAGRYKLSIVEVTRAGYSFDPDNSNMLSADIDIAP